MAEQVQTGGVMQFRYSNERSRISQEERDDIEEAYEMADERKKREKKRRVWLLILLGIIIVVVVAGVVWYLYTR